MYEFITKTINDAKVNVGEDLNWTEIKSFNVGRPKNARNPPIKRAILGIAVIAYLLFGFALFISVKLFSSRPHAYRFARLVFQWPAMFGVLIRVLSNQDFVMKKPINMR